jgi:hypothetical protein
MKAKLLTVALLAMLAVAWTACHGVHGVDASGLGGIPADAALMTAAAAVVGPAYLGEEVVQGGLTSGETQRRRTNTREQEIQAGLPKLKPRMRVDEIGRIMPHVFDRNTCKRLTKCADFTATLGGYELRFQHGVLVSIDQPVAKADPEPARIELTSPVTPKGLPGPPAMPAAMPVSGREQ